MKSAESLENEIESLRVAQVRMLTMAAQMISLQRTQLLMQGMALAGQDDDAVEMLKNAGLQMVNIIESLEGLTRQIVRDPAVAEALARQTEEGAS